MLMGNIFKRAWYSFRVMIGAAAGEEGPAHSAAQRHEQAIRTGQREERDIVKGADAGWPDGAATEPTGTDREAP